MLLQGARHVGKTYLIREFGRREYADTAYLNFERTPALGSLFDASLDPRSLILSLSCRRRQEDIAFDLTNIPLYAISRLPHL